MMKRFELSRFSPLEVSRRVQQCLRFEGVNTNGVAAASDNIGVAAETESMSPLGTPSGDGKASNLLTTIKKKLRKSSKRGGKRCEGRSGAGHSENCELHGSCCAKHYRTALRSKAKHGEKSSSVWPASILRSQNHQQCENDVSHLLPCSADEPEPCSCLLAQTPPSPYACDASPRLDDASPSPLLDPTTTPVDASALYATTGGASALYTTTNDASALYARTGDASTFCEDGPAIYATTEERSVLRDDPSALYATTEDRSVLYATTTDPSGLFDPSAQPRVGNLTQELYKLSKYGWYWGPINRSEAEEKLVDQPDGAFLVRDSSDDRYILSLSFRSYGKTLHTRIEHSNGLFSFYSQPEPEGHNSIVELIQQSMCYSQSGVFCYSRSRSPGSPSFPVRLTKPVSRFTQVRSLQYLCRFVIRQFTRYDHIQKLPLPPRIKGYLEEGHY